MRHRPGLPPQRLGQSDVRRQLRFQLGFNGQRHQWHELEFQRNVAQSQQRERSRLRLSVALPLGINGTRAFAGTDWGLKTQTSTDFFIRILRIMRHRPGLPPQRLGRSDVRRQLRFQLGFNGQRHQWHELEFQRNVAQSQQREQPRLRLSVALPLGINGRTASFNASLYPTFELSPAVRRIARAEASPSGGPQLTLLLGPAGFGPNH